MRHATQAMTRVVEVTSQLPRLTPFICARPDLTAARLSAAEVAARDGCTRHITRTAPQAADASADICMVQVDRNRAGLVEATASPCTRLEMQRQCSVSRFAQLTGLSAAAVPMLLRPIRGSRVQQIVGDCGPDSCKSYYGLQACTSVFTAACQT